MAALALTSDIPLRVLFDKLVEEAPELREARIDALGLPVETRLRLRMMLAFDGLIGQAPELREAQLNALDFSEADRDRLREMLVADANVPVVLRATAAEAVERLSDDDDDMLGQPLVGTCIGTFRLLSLIGQGGSSTVFRAEREAGEGKQIVALKLLRTGLYTAEAQRRFRREEAILAQLTHPHIASLIEGGVSASGIPYIAMELVDGVPITQAAGEQKANVAQRLRWFSTLCRTIEAAHAALIVHRDLKPSNLLVTRSGELKVLDFGIAKLLDTDSFATHTQSIALTPEYAAPEQYGTAALTTAVDVYALGVVLGELLTGKRLMGSLLASGAVAGDRDTVSPLPDGLPARQTLARQLRGDLDAILATALADVPASRYRSAGAFADDIERYLAGQPVRAHPPSHWYRVRKFVARHRGAIVATVLLMGVILSSLGLALWQGNEARKQAQLARSEAQRANATRDLMVGLFEAASAELPRGERPTPEQLILEAAKRVRSDASMDASLRMQILRTLGKVARSAGNYAQATALLDEAIQSGRKLGVSTSTPEMIDALVEKGHLLHSINHSAEADRLMASLLPELLAGESESTVSGLMLYAATRTYAGHADDGIAIAQQAVGKAQLVFGADSDNAIKTQLFLGQLYSSTHRYLESAQLLEPTIARLHTLQLPETESFARALFHLAVAKQHLGQPAAAEPLLREGIALMRRVFEGPHDRIAVGLGALARFLIPQERFDEAEAALDEALAIDRKLLGPDNVATATVLGDIALLNSARHRDADAERLLREALAVFVAHAQQSGYEDALAMTRLHLAETLIELNRLDEAAELQALAAPTLSALFGENSDESVEAIRIGGRIALAQHDHDGALAASDRALAILDHMEAPNPRIETLAHSLRAQALGALGRREESLAAADTAISIHQAAYPQAQLMRTALLDLRAGLLRNAARMDSPSSKSTEAPL